MEDQAFNAALCHYFLWKSELEKTMELQGSKKASVSTPTDTDATKDADKKLPAQEEETKNSAKYKKLLDTMRELFPNMAPLPPDARIVQPILPARYLLFPQLHQEVCFLRARVREHILATTSPKKKRKRKSDSAGDTAGVDTAMQLSYRDDVPGVKKLRSAVRENECKEKQKSKTKIARLEQQVTKVPKQAKEASSVASVPAAKSPPPPMALAPLKTFDDRIKELEYFKSGNGHCRVPYKEPGGLGEWVSYIRRRYRALQRKSEEDRTAILNKAIGPSVFQLTAERIARLEALDFEWTPNRITVPWETRYEQLLEFKEKEGHANVPRQYKANPALGEWLYMQRRLYRQKSEVLQGERQQKLEAAGVEWVLCKAVPRWDDRIEECRNFRRTHGHLKIPAPIKDSSQLSKNEKSFRFWGERIRTEYWKFQSGGKTCTLDRKRIKMLDDMGFDWTSEKKSSAPRVRGKSKDEVTWDEQWSKLKFCKDLFGDVNGINNIKAACPGDQALLHWVKVQRKMYKSLHKGEWSSLTTERRLKLETLDFDFAPRRHYAPPGSKKKEAQEAASASTSESDE